MAGRKQTLAGAGLCALSLLPVAAGSADLREVSVGRDTNRYSLVSETWFAAPKEELFEDLDNAVDGDGLEVESGFFHHVYFGAYDVVGGHPYTTMIADYHFDSSPNDDVVTSKAIVELKKKGLVSY